MLPERFRMNVLLGKKSMWYDELSEEEIEAAKNNRIPNYLLTDSEFEILVKIPTNELQYNIDAKWRDCLYIQGDDDKTWFHRDYDCVYRLRPDWKKPENCEYEFCPIAVGRKNFQYVWKYKRNRIWQDLNMALMMPEFAGCEFESEPGKFLNTISLFNDGRLVRPVRVRFLLDPSLYDEIGEIS